MQSQGEEVCVQKCRSPPELTFTSDLAKLVFLQDPELLKSLE